MYSIDIINQICTDLGTTAGHVSEIDGINAICVALGGVGGWDSHKLSLNEICSLNGKTSNYYYNIDSLNALIDGVKYQYEDAAWLSIKEGSVLNPNPPSGNIVFMVAKEDPTKYATRKDTTTVYIIAKTQ